MGGPPLPVALNSLRLRVDGKYRPDVDVGSTGGRKMDVIKIPPPCRDAFLQRCDQRLNKCLVCYDKNCAGNEQDIFLCHNIPQHCEL